MRSEATWNIRRVFRGSLFAIIFMFASTANAQNFVMELPDKSQAAEVSQRIGLTDIIVRYNRPLVNGRKIWDGLVPYGKVWRAGANMNTTIRFTDPVTIEGRPLLAGVYGIHMIPNAGEWTVIFSKNSTSWGSFTYKPEEDALRVSVRPTASEMHEALTYEFDDVRSQSAVVALKWAELAVPVHVSVDVHKVVEESLARQLRTLQRYMWNSWNEGANYLLSEHLDLEQALAYANRSISQEDRFDNEITKSKVLAELQRQPEADAARKRALEVGTSAQLDDYATNLLAANKSEEAFAVFQENAHKHPADWISHEGLARMYSAQGKFDEAQKEMQRALDLAPADQKSELTELASRLAAKRDINK
jgi:hypothetical protein